MGLSQSSLVESDAPCLVVERMTRFPRGGRGIEHAKPPGLNVDDALWSELVRRVDPLARDLNRGMAVFNVVIFLLTAAFVLLVLVSWSFDLRISPVVLVPILFVISLLTPGYILHVKNRGVDRRIEEALGELGPRLEARGYRVQYKTQHTALFKPARFMSERVISFTVGTSVETGNSMAAAAAIAPPAAPGAIAAPVGAERLYTTDAGSSGGWEGEGGTGGKSLKDQLEGGAEGKSLMDQLKS